MNEDSGAKNDHVHLTAESLASIVDKKSQVLYSVPHDSFFVEH